MPMSLPPDLEVWEGSLSYGVILPMQLYKGFERAIFLGSPSNGISFFFVAHKHSVIGGCVGSTMDFGLVNQGL